MESSLFLCFVLSLQTLNLLENNDLAVVLKDNTGVKVLSDSSLYSFLCKQGGRVSQRPADLNNSEVISHSLAYTHYPLCFWSLTGSC